MARGKRKRKMVRKWEDLQADCLDYIFQKLGVKDLATRVPLVCKSWREVTLGPLCWQVLNFGTDVFHERPPFAMNHSRLLRFLFYKSDGSSKKIIFPDVFFQTEDVVQFLEKFPAVETLALPPLPHYHLRRVYDVVTQQKNLQCLYMRYKPNPFKEFLGNISQHLKNLRGLQLCGRMRAEDATAIVALLPKFRYLCLTGCIIEKPTLLIILKGCCELVEFHVEQCVCLLIDQEVLDSAAHVKIFKCDRNDWDTAEYAYCGCNDEVQFHVSFQVPRAVLLAPWLIPD